MTDRRQDDGFTLVELLMVIAMTSIIMTALASAFTTGLRTTTATGTRLSETADLQLLSAYFPQDIQSAGIGAGDVDTTATATAGCSGLDGSNVLALRWTDFKTGTSYGATYRTRVSGTEQQLVRYTCSGGVTSMLVMGRSLQPLNGATADVSANPRISLTLRLASGYVATLTAVRRTVNGAAPAPPPPASCVVTSAVLFPDSGAVAPTGTLVVPPTLTITTTAGCGTLSASYAPDGATAASSPLVGGTTRTATLTATGWTAGARPVDVVSGASVLAEVPFQVDPATPCAVTNVSVNPTAGTRTANPAPNRLTQGAVTVTADFSPTCLGFNLVFDPTSNTTTPTASSAAFAAVGATRSVTIPASTSWSDGSHTFLIRDTTTVAATTTFNVTPAPCQVTGVSLSPTTVNKNSKGKLNHDVAVTVTTTGVCSGLKVGFDPGSGGVQVDLTESAVGSGSWSATVAADDYSWTSGGHVFTPLAADNSTLGTQTATLTVAN